MEIKNINGNLLDSNAEYIMHQVNCQGVMGSGVAKAIKDKWPVVFEKYEGVVELANAADGESLLGRVLPVKVSPTQTVMNLFGQNLFGYDGDRYTSYDAIDRCIRRVAERCREAGVKSVALPWHMSSDRGGANWNIIMEMIKQHFGDLDIIVEIWKLQ